MSGTWSWLALLALGAYHGINPGMGWLFAVALGLQEKSRRAVLAALPPIALGHALAICVVVALLYLAQASLPARAVRYAAAALLFGFGLYRILRARHPVWVGMRVSFRDLTLWSFMMASAHGAGLMLAPLLLDVPDASHAAHAGQVAIPKEPWRWLAAVGVHTAGHLVVAALIALLVYEKLGLKLLGRAWFNLDLLWSVVLLASGLIILFT
jgi:hypothetical protein